MKKLFPIKKAILLVATILFGMASIHAATITVSADPVSEGVNYNTIQAAYDYIKTLGTTTPISEAYVIEIQSSYAGETSYPITLGAIPGASATNTITIKPAIGAKIIISNPVATSQVQATTAVTNSFTSFTASSTTGLTDGMTITGPGITAGTTITLSGTTVTLSQAATSAAISGAAIIATSGSFVSTTNSAASSNSTSLTVASATGINVNDYVYSSGGITSSTKVTAINGSVLTLSAARTVTNGSTLYFSPTPVSISTIPNSISITTPANTVTSGMTVFGLGINTNFAYPTVSSYSSNSLSINTAGGSTFANGAALYIGTAGTKTIRFSGANYVIIDGISRTDATTGLTIQNPNSIVAKTITFEGADNNNIIRNCFIRGANISGDANNNGACAQIHFMTTASGKNNIIENNDICDVDGSTMPISMFSFANSSGGASDLNIYNTIQNNNIYNFNVTASSPVGNVGAFNFPSSSSPNVWVLNNHIYWTKTLANTTNDFYVFGFGSSTTGAGSKVEGNVVGGNASDNSGVANFNFNKATFSVYNVNDNTTLKNNTVKNLNITAVTATTFYGIRISANQPAKAPTDADAWSGNTVKDITIAAQSTTAQAVGFTIASAAAHTARNISNNEVSGLSIACSTAATQVIVRGIQTTGTVPTSAFWNYSNNKIFNLTGGNSTSTSANTIIGLDLLGSAATVDKNLIYNLKPITAPTTRTGALYGLRMTTGNTTGTIIKNNTICLGNDVTNDLTTFLALDQYTGTLPASAIIKYYNNSVYVGGNSGDNSTGKSYAFYSQAPTTTATTFDIKNNIFVNQRINGATPTATAKHYAFGFTTASVIKSCDNNLYYATPLGFTSASTDKNTLADWQGVLVTGSDAASKEGNPGFVDIAATTPDFHITSASSLANKSGVLLSDVSDDFAGMIRADYTPNDMGAYVISGSTAVAAASQVIGSVYGEDKAILFNNCNGQTANVFSLNGQLVRSVLLTSDKVSVFSEKGFYVVNIGTQNVKVIVK